MISRSWGASNISLYPNYKIVGCLNPPILHLFKLGFWTLSENKVKF